MGLSFVLLSCYLLCMIFWVFDEFSELGSFCFNGFELGFFFFVSMVLGFFYKLSCCLLCMFFWMFDEFSELGSFCFTYYVSMQCYFW